MKTALKLSLIAAPFVLVAAAHASTGTGHIGANILAPITVTGENPPMNFGTVLPSGTAGTVSTATTSATNGIVVNAGSITPDTFNVTGSPTMAYTVTGPSSTSIASGNNNMTVNLTYPSNPLLDGTGAGTFVVQGLLNVGATQAGGNYSGQYTVNVNY